jgi:WD40 repeat protein
VALSPDGRLLLTGCNASHAYFFDTATGALVYESLPLKGPVVNVAFRPDGRAALTASAGGDPQQAAQIWHLPPPPVPRRLAGHGGGAVEVVCFRPGGRTFLTAGADGVARLWDAVTGQPHGLPMRHARRIRAAAFSPDGRTVLTASDDKTARLWDADTGQPRGGPLAHPTGVGSAAFSPDGKLVVTAGSKEEAKVRLWEAATGRLLGSPLPAFNYPQVPVSGSGLCR